MNLIFKSAIILAVVAGTSTIKKEMKTIKTNESSAVWTGKKFGGSHTGTIDIKNGTLEFNDNLLSGGSFVIDMSSINVTDLTGESKGKLEGHLKSDDFFSTESYPEATLEFTDVKKSAANFYAVTADLTVKGTTHPVNFDLAISDNKATTTVVIDRSKYNVKYGSKSFFQGLGDNFIYDDFEVDVNLVY